MERDYPNLLIESKKEINSYLYSERIPLLTSLAFYLFPQANHLQMDQLKQLCEDVIFFFRFKSILHKNLRLFTKGYQWKMLPDV